MRPQRDARLRRPRSRAGGSAAGTHTGPRGPGQPSLTPPAPQRGRSGLPDGRLRPAPSARTYRRRCGCRAPRAAPGAAAAAAAGAAPGRLPAPWPPALSRHRRPPPAPQRHRRRRRRRHLPLPPPPPRPAPPPGQPAAAAGRSSAGAGGVRRPSGSAGGAPGRTWERGAALVVGTALFVGTALGMTLWSCGSRGALTAPPGPRVTPGNPQTQTPQAPCRPPRPRGSAVGRAHSLGSAPSLSRSPRGTAGHQCCPGSPVRPHSRRPRAGSLPGAPGGSSLTLRCSSAPGTAKLGKQRARSSPTSSSSDAGTWQPPPP